MSPRLAKILSTAGVFVAAFFITIIVILTTLIDPNDFKADITQLVKKQTGQTLEIRGDVEWSFFPWIGLKAKQVQLDNPKGFEGKPLANIGEADINIRLFPLLIGNIKLGKIGLENAHINLIKNQNGDFNWQHLVSGKTAAQKKQVNKTKFATKKIKNLSITSLNINNANLTWIDQTTQKTTRVTDLQLQSKNIGLSKSFPIKLSFHLERSKPYLSMQFSLSGKGKFISEEHYQFDKLVSTVSFIGKQYSNDKLSIEASTNIDLDLGKETFALTNLNARIANMNTEGQITGTHILTSPTFEGRLKIDSFNVKRFITALGYPIKTSNNYGFRTGSGNIKFETKSKQFNLTKLRFNLDDSIIDGNAEFSNDKTKAINFNVDVDKINLNNYQFTLNRSNTATQSSGTGSYHNNSDSFYLKGKLQIGNLTIGKTPLYKVNTIIRSSNGITQIEPLTAQIYGGKLQGNILINHSYTSPQYNVNLTLNNFKIQQLSSHSLLSGTANLNAKLSTSGTSASARLKNLNGTVAFKSANGYIKNISIKNQLEKIKRFLKTGKETKPSSKGQTTYSLLKATANIKRGIIFNKDLSLQAHNLEITGHGRANLNDERLNYYLEVHSSKELDTLLGIPLLKIGTTTLPIRVTGTFDHPIVRPDFASIGQILIKNKIQEGIGNSLDFTKNVGKQVSDKLKQGVTDTLKQGLDKIFGN